MKFNEYLKQLRERRGMSQRELADASNISSAEISRLESGIRQKASPVVLKALAVALNVPYNELMRVAGYTEDETDKPIIAAHIPDMADLSEEELDEVRTFIDYIKHRRK